MSRAQLFWLACLFVAVVLSGMGVVYAKYLSRSLFVEQQVKRCTSTMHRDLTVQFRRRCGNCNCHFQFLHAD